MKRPLEFFSLFALLLGSTLLTNEPIRKISKDEDLLPWSSSRRLTWSDYLAQPDPSSDAAASTTTFLGIDYHFTSNGFTYKIDSRFSKVRSWGLYKTEYILSHEQGHFDIAEVFARKLHKKMSEYNFDRKTYQKDLKKIYDEVIEEKEETQNKYDRETRHSINKQKQAEWLQRIEEMLSEYADWADY
jgi:Bacterial protein of unknown function (DUF922)